MADSTTQHAPWGAPTPSARPGSASKPDSPRVTSNVPNAGDPTGNTPLDPALLNNPKQGGVGASSPVVNPPAGPSGSGNSGNGGNTQSDPGNAGGEDQGPKSPVEGSTENHSGDPSAHNPDPADPLQNPVDPQPNSVPGFEIGKSVVGVNTNPIYHVGSQTLVPGGPAVTINNVPYALAPSGNAMVAGTKTVPIQPPPAGKLPDIQIGGKTYQANKDSQYIVGDQTLRPNGPPAVIDHVTYSIAPSASAIVSNGHTITLAPSRQDPAVVIIDNQPFSQDTQPRITIHGQEIVAGGPSITIDHTPYAIASAGDTLIAGTSAIPLETHAVPQPGGNSASPNTNNNNNNNNHAGSNDMALIIKNPGSRAASTLPIAHPSSPNRLAENAILTINGKAYTADSSSHFIIGSQTLAPGSPAITVGGTPYSLRPIPQSIPQEQQRTTSPSPSTQTTPTPYAIFTLNNSTYTCTRNQNCTIASQTLTPNGTITVGDETVVYGTNGIDVVKPQTQSAGESRGEVITSHISGLTPLEEATRTTAGTGAAEPTGERGKKSDAGAILRGAGAEGVMGLWVAAVVAAMVV
ncbi:MAG: hypothetical protein Q9228_003859 [Teloschistes exilis]